MRLFLCEKPSQARDIAQIVAANRKMTGYLEGVHCRVTWCLGHLLEMVMPEAYQPEWKSWRMEPLPILPQVWKLAVRQEVMPQFRVIESLLRTSSEVVIATDADREGETIGRELLVECGYRGPVSRLWLSALDESSIRKALQAIRPGAQTEPLYQAGVGRARADWMVGINLSRAYTLLGRQIGHDGVLSVGRVQTPTLKLVVDRDRLIEQFQPTPYHEVWVDLQSQKGPFRAQWQPAEEQADAEGRCLQRPWAETVLRQVEQALGEVQKSETKRVKEAPPLPLDLSTLQQEASRRWSMSASRTLEVAQALYETHKVITYPRTDCRHLPNSQWGEAARILAALGSNDPALQPVLQQAQPALRSRAWDDARITAHHAIIPTGINRSVAALPHEERQLYDWIQRHYIAQFFPAFEYDQSVIELLIRGHRFRATGRVTRLPGWKVVLQSQPTAPAGEQADKEQALPALQRGDTAQVMAANLLDKLTKAPERYTEGSLIQAMKLVGKTVENPRLRQILRETAGIGTEATRAAIIDTLVKRQLLFREGKNRLVSAAAGRILVDLLPHSVTDPATTAVWEQALEDIAQGQGTLEAFQEKVVIWVNRLIAQVKARSQSPATVAALLAEHANLLHNSSPPTAEAAKPGRSRSRRTTAGPGGSRSRRQSRTRVTPTADTTPPPHGQSAQHPCPLCHQGHLVQRVAGRGQQAGQPFWGCSGYPACRYTRPCSGNDSTPGKG
ncbi:MAG: DNA topoisomerase 3 [Magnetococcales bacterium]|nr:DNA topoisomerase 3 [Magnetococcales bacterium]MBF0116423.1 DNA topoisomerase 3 [Magnetococcales bacterium]